MWLVLARFLCTNYKHCIIYPNNKCPCKELHRTELYPSSKIIGTFSYHMITSLLITGFYIWAQWWAQSLLYFHSIKLIFKSEKVWIHELLFWGNLGDHGTFSPWNFKLSSTHMHTYIRTKNKYVHKYTSMYTLILTYIHVRTYTISIKYLAIKIFD